jgi:hypothetical protein
MKRQRVLLFAALVVAAGLLISTWPGGSSRTVQAAPSFDQTALPGGGSMSSAMVGHEFRQDDLPSIAASPDGSLWVSWLSFVGDRDDVVIRQYKDGVWGALQWTPGTSGDSWMPQVGVDAENRVWVVWSQQVRNNWDLYARRFDPAREEWGPIERLTSNPLPDIHPRMVSDGKGRLALVWQGFRGRHSSVFLKTFDGTRWSAEVRVTMHQANDWEPAAAFDGKGAIWVAYDSYKNGNYDVFLKKVESGQVGTEIPVAVSPSFDTKPTIAADKQDRIWVAWEQGRTGWGKDQGYILRQAPRGAPIGGERRARLRCYDNGQWREPAKPVDLGQGNTYQPHVYSDGKASVWLAAKRRLTGPEANRGYWEYWMTHLDGDGWSTPFALPNSRGRSSTRIPAVLDAGGSLWAVWTTDNRGPGFYHRPMHQRVYAGRIPPAAETATMSWGAAPQDFPPVEGHANEKGDLLNIRGYTAPIGGKLHHIVRGDFHRHTELSWDGGGAQDGSLQDFYRYMIDAASMDFGASTDHQGGAWPYWWWYTQKMTDMHHVPGAYTAIYGYERSAVFPNGHRNMFFARRSDSRVTPFHLRSGAKQFFLGANAIGDEPGIGSGDLVSNDTKLLYEDIRNRNAIAISHTSGTRMGTDWRDNDPQLEPVVEIYQGARTNYEQLGAPLVAREEADAAHMKQAGYQPEGMVANAWAKGYKLGIITSSDHGSTHISYAMVYTADNSRQGILDAIRKRHTYGAMDNIILDARMGEHFMGDEFALQTALPIQVKVRAPKNIAKVHIIKDSKVIYTVSPNRRDVQFEYTDKGDAKGRHFYYVRVEQEDKMLAWSSPFFINYGGR